MSYVKQTWVTGDVITAEKLNHMEDGIEGAFPVAELVIDGSKFTVKATPDTIDSVFVAVGDGIVIYRTISEGSENTNYYAVFMGNIESQSIVSKQFIYDETAGGYVYSGGLG